MTSSGTSKTTTSLTSPTKPEKNTSLEISAPFSVTENPDRFRSVVLRNEYDRVRFCLSLLDCVEGPDSFPSYEAQRAFEIKHMAFWLVFLQGTHWFLPSSTLVYQIDEAAKHLQAPKQDTAELRRALLDLWLTTSHQKLNEDDRDAQIRIYLERLSYYPPQLATLVLHEASQQAKFWPSWAELYEKLETYSDERLRLLQALRIARRKLKG